MNINRIARRVNAGIARAEDAKREPYLLDQIYELMFGIAPKETLASNHRKGYNDGKHKGE